MTVKKTARTKTASTPVPVDSTPTQPQAAARPAATRRRAAAAAPPKAPKSAKTAPEASVPTRKATPARVARVVEAPAPEVRPAAPAAARRPTDEEIRVRAYFLALEHKGRGGSLDYWLLAERELRSNASSGE